MSEAPVLLVEDDPSDARLIQRAFDKLPAKIPVIRLTNGDEAVSYLAGDAPFDNRAAYPLPKVLLLDIKLPRRSGFEVLQWIRKQRSGLHRMLVVVLTSSSHSVDIERAYDLGANSYLTKPENSTDLLQLCSEVTSYWLSLNQPPDLAGGPRLGM